MIRESRKLVIAEIVCVVLALIISCGAVIYAITIAYAMAGEDTEMWPEERAVDFCLTQVIPAQAAPDETHFLHVIYYVTGPDIYKVSGRVHRVNPQGVVDRSGVFTCEVRVRTHPLSVTLIDSSLN